MRRGNYRNHNFSRNVSRPVHGSKATNVVAETQAVIEALEIAERENMPGIKIYTDSHYVIDCVTKFMDNWKRTGFISSKGKPVANAVWVKQLDIIGSRVFHKLVCTMHFMNNCTRN